MAQPLCWKLHLRTNFPTSIPQEQLTPNAIMWLQFINTKVYLVANMCNIDMFQGTILHVILWKEKICVGTWIYQSMLFCVKKNKVELFFPHLVMALCKQAQVPIGKLECYLQPSKQPIHEPN
ncbi:hypothetical protein ES332_A10G163800v1 [Gossypium tomentosum]|uniref:Putative plant transposon protein domain-containing protein n=1 Tax=Gossypium tomentosum TaxID=34277 RepID=A0A5D2NSX0_GOSTO|nr:hypothetical protein ES332_A10G163800v1 [Gossypium tomentosum]